jgi:hypothetical protein
VNREIIYTFAAPNKKNNNEDDVDVIIHATAPTGNGLYRVAHLVSATRQVVFQNNSNLADGGIICVALQRIPPFY